jgi:hypothetical protein
MINLKMTGKFECKKMTRQMVVDKNFQGGMTVVTMTFGSVSRHNRCIQNNCY